MRDGYNIGTSEMGAPAVSTAGKGEIRTKTRCPGNTELTNLIDEEQKEGWWFRVHIGCKFAGKSIEL